VKRTDHLFAPDGCRAQALQGKYAPDRAPVQRSRPEPFVHLHLTARVDDSKGGKVQTGVGKRCHVSALNAAAEQGPRAVFLAKIQFSQTRDRQKAKDTFRVETGPRAIDSNESEVVLRLCEVWRCNRCNQPPIRRSEPHILGSSARCTITDAQRRQSRSLESHHPNLETGGREEERFGRRYFRGGVDTI
jgi:hypothetical protein